MRLHFLALVLLFAWGQNPAPTGGLIEGRVLRTGTAEPIPNTPVTLISSSGLSDGALTGLLDQMAQLVTGGLLGQGGGGSQDLTIRQVATLLQNAGPNVSTQASVLTDRAGRFQFTNLPPGRYTVWVQRFNYYGPLLNGVPTSTVSNTVILDPLKTIPAMDLYMTQGMAITGRVLDSLGQPAFGMGITAYRSSFAEGKPLWSPVLSRPIDDRGEYRLSPLPPGEYYVGVSPPLVSTAPAGQSLSQRTFFPGVTEPTQATRIALKDGDAPRVDFTLRSAPSTLLKVSGFAVNPAPVRTPAGIVDNGFNTFLLVPVDFHLIDSFSPSTFINVVSAASRAAGEFEIRNVRPGVYSLYPVIPNSGFLSGGTIVDVRSADAVGVRLAVSSVVAMQGSVVVAPGNIQRPVNLDDLRIVLRPMNSPLPGNTAVTVPVHESGQFTLNGPAAASVTVQVRGLPETAFVSEIRLGTSEIAGNTFEMSSSAALQVVVDASTGATLQTSVRTVDGRPAPHTKVVLVPAEDQRQNPARFVSGTTDNDGRAIIRGIAPGLYTAIAWESIPETAWLNKEFLAKYLDQGSAIRLDPGAQSNLQLNRIPFELEQR